jgi:hypothetical protein
VRLLTGRRRHPSLRHTCRCTALSFGPKGAPPPPLRIRMSFKVHTDLLLATAMARSASMR